MPIPAPPIDPRSSDQLVRRTEELLMRNTTWRPPASGNDAGRALVRLFARLAEIVIDRINRVPEKNFVAFLDLIGVQLRPPQVARVPLTFSLTPGAATDALVPRLTPVAAIPLESDPGPVVFETERDLVVTMSRLVALYVREPHQDLYSDHAATLADGGGAPFPVLTCDTNATTTYAISHRLYLGQASLLSLSGNKTMTVQLTLAPDSPQWRFGTNWSWWDGTAWHPLSSTEGVTGSTWTVTLTNVPQIPIAPFPAPTLRAPDAGVLSSAWLSAVPTTAIVPGRSLPKVTDVQTSATFRQSNLPLDLGLLNQTPLDLGKDFPPFGDKPKFNDTFFFACDEALEKKGAQITLTVTLTNVIAGTIPLPAKPADSLTLRWEFWNGTQWSTLGESGPGVDATREPTKALNAVYGFVDETVAFTQDQKTITFTCPLTLSATAVNGQSHYWLRVRIVAGNYGTEAHYESLDKTDANGVPLYKFMPATFQPPSLRTVVLGYSLPTPFTRCDAILADNNFTLLDHSDATRASRTPFSPFVAMLDTWPSLYMGFQRPGATTGFANRLTTLYCGVPAIAYDHSRPDHPVAATAVVVVWEYWNGETWTRLDTRDETQGFSQSGVVTFIGPADFVGSSEFGIRAFWLRARQAGTEAPLTASPVVQRILTNTVWASHTQTVDKEILGSSTGDPGQTFRMSKRPVLSGHSIEVREPVPPSAAERAEIEQEEGPDAITVVADDNGRPVETWVRWHGVRDFYASGPRSRHYRVDRLQGQVYFGDNAYGLVPPVGKDNLRATYQTGGGVQGNRPVGSLTQLKRTVPYIAAVTNWDPAGGGSEPEDLKTVKERGPKVLRHRERAVTKEDFEDLAFEVSPEVARVKSIPATDEATAGQVGILIVPRSREAKPVPSVALLAEVKAALIQQMSPTLECWVVGPDWMRVAVSADVVPVSFEEAADVQAAILTQLAAFLHPLTGGLKGEGWAFGRRPYRSDLYQVIERIAGVDHVRWLTVAEDPEGEIRADRFLVYSGEHSVVMVGGD